ncbi:MAG: hypothetical protein IJD93_05525 [Ruminococcus sp.]|nr:hypothetical protein [Ruminococcus sp.]
MKLFLKRDNSAQHTRFIVCDHNGKEKFTVTGRRYAGADKMLLCSSDSTPLVTIRCAPFHVFYAFVVKDSSDRFAITATKSRRFIEYRFHGISWTLCLSGDGRSFEIFDADGKLIMSQSADKYLLTGAYELDIYSEQRECFCIAAAICANAVSFTDAVNPVTV